MTEPHRSDTRYATRQERRRATRRTGIGPLEATVIGGLLVAVVVVAVWLIMGTRSSGNATNLSALPEASEPATPAITAEPATLPPEEPAPEMAPIILADFDASAALAEVRAIEAFGVRKGGSEQERQAADYIANKLRSFGLTPAMQPFPVPGGTSQNVVARIPGRSDTILILGAHVDSKPPSPGANDNGTGCGALLQLAEILASEQPTPTVEVVFFGSEEVQDGDPNHHHYGSRYHASTLDAATQQRTAGMFSIDMIGYGPDFHSRTMGRGPQGLSNLLLAKAAEMGIPMTYLKDPGSTGWSDHEPYELAGIPAAWIEWRDDPVYHTAADTSDRLDPEKVDAAGKLVLQFIRDVSEDELASLLAR